MEWQTIDSAPRDGTEFDAWTPNFGGYRLINVRWMKDWWGEGWANIYNDGFDNQDPGAVSEEISHWMPLPEPPK